MRWSIVVLGLLFSGMSGPLLNAQNFWQQSWGPSTVCVQALAVTHDGSLLAGTQGVMGSGVGILRSSNNGSTWVPINSGLLDTNVFSLLVTRKGNLFAGTTNFWRPQGACLYRSTDKGNSWIRTDSGLGGAGGVQCLAEDSAGGLYCGPFNGPRDVYRSTDDGAFWVPTACPQGDWSEALLVNREGTLFSAGFNSVYCSSNAGATWTKADSGLNQGLPLITSLAINREGVLFAGMGYGGGVYRSTNNGVLWTRTSLNSCDVRALTIAPGGVLFVGTFDRKGVFWSSDNGDTWHQENSGFPTLTSRVWSLAATQNGYVFAGTDSGGIFRSVHSITSTGKHTSFVPSTFSLAQNYPNPFNPITTIKYELPKSLEVRLSIFDMLGREVSVIVNERRDAGVHEVKFDGARLASGIYVYRLQSEYFVNAKRFVLLK